MRDVFKGIASFMSGIAFIMANWRHILWQGKYIWLKSYQGTVQTQDTYQPDVNWILEKKILATTIY